MDIKITHGCEMPNAGTRHRGNWRWKQRVAGNVAAVKDDSPAARAQCPECGLVWVVGVDHRVEAVFCSRRCKTRARRGRQAARSAG
ncbi:hypothetical protein [Actinomadura rudentiformis]|uniref:Uncharacterized protein n=1 Tax=Actinomadura rudentiformis TaxID=359158 RepID=A0A6H9Y7D7_9ACTN|nr:hypothetical protein [Actinomadura rudentiformis]KAB2340550.1 hypothetical protein F8566_44240 [Actinomadura rudentiformis]